MIIAQLINSGRNDGYLYYRIYFNMRGLSFILTVSPHPITTVVLLLSVGTHLRVLDVGIKFYNINKGIKFYKKSSQFLSHYKNKT